MSMEYVNVQIVDKDLWKQFYPVNEMIVTKKGRTIFPRLEFIVDGLNPQSYYTFELRMERVDDMKYKYDDGKWSELCDSPTQVNERTVRHSDNFKLGSEWMQKKLSFPKLKITNNNGDTCPNNIILQSMHKYIPVFTVLKMRQSSDMYQAQTSQMQHFEASDYKEYRFDYTSFIAVTAYQNINVTNLKVEHNKYARGFRADRKRGYSESPYDIVQEKPAKMAYMAPTSNFVNAQAMYPTMLTTTPKMEEITNQQMQQQFYDPRFFEQKPFQQASAFANYGYPGYPQQFVGYPYSAFGYGYMEQPQMQMEYKPQFCSTVPQPVDPMINSSFGASPNSSYGSE